ncbi:MAG: hypothetical protein H0X43_04790 [Nitrosospira sp.]|nr:hypothetical protein [Nitrosospira sp.]
MTLLVKIFPAFFVAITYAHAGPRVTLSIGDVHSPVLNVGGVQVSLSGSNGSLLEIKLDEITVEGKTWRDLQFTCPGFDFAKGVLQCDDGVLRMSRSAAFPVTFHFSSADKTLDAKIRTASNGPSEGWRLTARWEGGGWEGVLSVRNGQAAQIAGFLPAGEGEIAASPTSGKINGKAKLRVDTDGLAGIEADLAVDELAFSDASGLHAGENITVELNAKAVREVGGKGNSWQWQADLNWRRGEIFWQPLYFAARGHRFNANGYVNDDAIGLNEGTLLLAGIGKTNFSGVIDRATVAPLDFNLSADNLELAGLFSDVLKPFLVNTVFADLKASGQAGVRWRFRAGAHDLLHVDLRGASVEDERERFAFRGVNATIPWQAQRRTQANISIHSSQLGKLPIGELHIPLQIDGFNFRIPRMVVPILDGKLTLEDFAASPPTQEPPSGWQWQFSGGLSPLSMQKLTEVLGIQIMQGTLSGEIPRVSYNGSVVEVDGALLFKIFDGTVELGNLKLLNPMGRAPTLMADVTMRNLDLNQLTGTFSFGSIQGRVDATVSGLELFNWKPVKFDASLRSSPGNYPRRISQAAVQNISSLGGGGAAAAIQRSFLRVFDQFGYSEIGWSCSLRNGVCRMGGIELQPMPHGYLIVKGGGIPAITVMGYNSNVDWEELVSRLERITQANVKPVFQ